MTHTAGKRFFTPQDLSNHWSNSISVMTLANWRSRGRGPQYVKVGGRVLYPADKVAEWEAKNLVENTSQYKA